MTYISDVELIEIVPDLRAMARTETVPEVRAALDRLADRYAALAAEPHVSREGAMACRFAA
nr:hypothetical protein [uncultured Rhodopila sp.]